MNINTVSLSVNMNSCDENQCFENLIKEIMLSFSTRFPHMHTRPRPRAQIFTIQSRSRACSRNNLFATPEDCLLRCNSLGTCYVTGKMFSSCLCSAPKLFMFCVQACCTTLEVFHVYCTTVLETFHVLYVPC